MALGSSSEVDISVSITVEAQPSVDVVRNRGHIGHTRLRNAFPESKNSH